MGSFFSELRRRNVFRVAVLYGIASWLILQVSDIVMPALGLPEWTLTLVLYLLAIGFPIALIFAWAFELTPEGLKRTGDVDPDASIAPATGQKLNNLVIGVLAVAVIALLVDKFLLSEPAGAPQTAVATPAQGALTSIAVLPFVDMSPDQDQEYFTDGISEELLNLLAKIKDFRVAGRTSSFAFKDKNEDLRLIGEKLGVATILEGSVRKHNDQIRVTAQLVKVDDGYHLWSETYDRRLDDVFAIQDDIATEVVAALKHRLLGEEEQAIIASAPRTQNTEAYTAYLRGKHVIRVRNEENLFKALREFRHATEVDPAFAPAWAGVANAYSLLANYDYRPRDEVLPLAREASDKALALDPDLADAWAAKGLLLMQRRAMPEESIPVLEKAMELNPGNVEAQMWLGSQLRSAGRFDEAWRVYQRAYEIDPLFPVLLSNLAMASTYRGNDGDTARYLTELDSVAPDAITTYRSRALSDWDRGDLVASFRALKTAVDRGLEDVFLVSLLADRYLDYDEPDDAMRMVGLARDINPLSGWAASIEICKLYLQGGREQAERMTAEALVRQPDEEILRLNAATFAILRDDPETARTHLEIGLKSDARSRNWIVDNPDALFSASYLIDIYRQSGEQEAARALYDTASRFVQRFAWGTDGTWWTHTLQAWIDGGIGDVEAMKLSLEKAADRGGQSFYWSPWATMMLRYADDPAVAEQLGRLEARRQEVRQALITEGLIEAG